MYNTYTVTQCGISCTYTYLNSWKNCWWSSLHSFPLPVWYGSRGGGGEAVHYGQRGTVNVVFKVLLNIPQIFLPFQRILFEYFLKLSCILHGLQSWYEDSICGALLLKLLFCFHYLALWKPWNLMHPCFLHTCGKLHLITHLLMFAGFPYS